VFDAAQEADRLVDSLGDIVFCIRTTLTTGLRPDANARALLMSRNSLRLTSQGSALISQNNRGTTVLPAKARMR
jgi:hypothetical protein